MSRQGLSSAVSGIESGMPQLARQYISAHSDVGISVWVHRREFVKFRDAERELLSKGIRISHFATYVVKRYIDYCKSKGMSRVPLNMFLGPTARIRYLDFVAATGVDRVDSDDDHEQLYSELMVGEEYIRRTLDGESIHLRQVIDDLDPLLSTAYVRLRPNEKAKLRKEVIEHLRLTHALNGAVLNTYDDVVSCILLKREEA